MTTENKNLLAEIIKRRSFISYTALLTAYGLILPLKALAGITAKGIRLGKNGTGTRFVLDVSHEIKYTMFFLSEPKRLVIDIPAIKLDGISSNITDNSGLISAIRFGEASLETARIVFDLENAVMVSRVFTLAPQSGFDWRFVVDLEKTTEQDFAERLGASNAITNISPSITLAQTNNDNKMTDYPPRPNVKPVENTSRNTKPVIVLDPGHGGRDPGAIGITGVFEKDVALAMAQELRRKIEKTGEFQVVLTRSKDETLSLRKRVEIARKARGDLFISLHADSIAKRDVRGLSVYTLSEKSSDAEAAALAVRENKADIIAGIDLYNELPEVANFLIDLTRRETMNLSAEFATIKVNEMLKSFNLLRNTHRFAGFAVLKAPDVPSVLFEMGYLSNPEEERLLRQSSYRGRLADATIASISKYFNSKHSASLF